MTADRPALTLVELVVVLVILAILGGLLLPAQRRVRVASEQVVCTNNLKQLLLALHTYHSQHGRLPPGCLGPTTGEPADRLGWPVAILKYVEQDELARRFDPDAGYTANAVTAQLVKAFRCPVTAGNPTLALMSYVGSGGVGADAPARPAGSPGVGLFGYDCQLSLKDVTDGTSNTVALMETHDRPGPWARGGFDTVRGVVPTTSLTSPHRGGVLVGLADGSVRFVADNETAALTAAATVAGGEPVHWD